MSHSLGGERRRIFSVKGNYFSHNSQLVSGPWLLMAPFCTLSSQHASESLCVWKKLVKSCLSFLRCSHSYRKMVYLLIETGLRKQWPAQPSGSFSGASVFKDERICRSVFLGCYWGWWYRLGIKSVFTHLLTVTFSLTASVSAFSSQVFATNLEHWKNIWINSFWQKRAISRCLKAPFYTFPF